MYTLFLIKTNFIRTLNTEKVIKSVLKLSISTKLGSQIV